MVPQLSDLREEILREFYCSRFSMHPGGTKMYRDLHRQYYWSGMKRDVGDFIRRCLMCQQVKAEKKASRVTLAIRGSRVEVGARHDGLCDLLAMDTAEA